MGWADLQNGRLLAVAATQFDVVITSDANLRYQQNLNRLPIAVVVLRATANTAEKLLPLVPHVELALSTLGASHLIEVHSDGTILRIDLDRESG